MNQVRIIGGGLAGCEAAWQLARRGIAVELFEMRPETRTGRPRQRYLGELVCSNSLRSDSLSAPAGLLKAEMRRLDSLMIRVRRRKPRSGGLGVGGGSRPFRAALDPSRRRVALMSLSFAEEVRRRSVPESLSLPPGRSLLRLYQAH